MPGAATRQEAIIRAIGPERCLTTSQIAGAIGRPHKQVATACSTLVTSRMIERVEVGCFRLTPAGREVERGERTLQSGPRSPLCGPRIARADTLRQRAWAAMRLTRRFTVPEIVTLAARPEDGAAETHLAKWWPMLMKAGYLAVLPRRAPGSAPTSNGYKCWALIRDTGDIAPLVRSDGTYYDYNTGEGTPRRKGGAPCSR